MQLRSVLCRPGKGESYQRPQGQTGSGKADAHAEAHAATAELCLHTAGARRGAGAGQPAASGASGPWGPERQEEEAEGARVSSATPHLVAPQKGLRTT